MRPLIASLLNEDLLEDLTTEERMTIYRRVVFSVRGIFAVGILIACVVLSFEAAGYVNWSSLLILPLGCVFGLLVFNRIVRGRIDREVHRLRPTCCPACGHWMGHDTSGVCPECGHRSMQALVHDELEPG